LKKKNAFKVLLYDNFLLTIIIFVTILQLNLISDSWPISSTGEEIDLAIRSISSPVRRINFASFALLLSILACFARNTVEFI